MNKIAIVILNYNNYIDTEKCVDNILSKQITADVVIVDNNSENESFSYLSMKYGNLTNVFVIRNVVNSGYSAGNNFGAKFAINNNKFIEYICIMNPDTLFNNENLLYHLQSVLEKYDDVAIAAPVMVQNNIWDINRTYWDIPNTWDMLRRQIVTCRKRNQARLYLLEDYISCVGVVHGSFFMVKVESLKKINFLDEHIFLYGEENLLSLKLRDIGLKEVLVLNEFFFHLHDNSGKRIKLKTKLKKISIVFNSRRYVYKMYYNKMLLPLLYIFQFINYIIIISKHILGTVKRRKTQ